jgi:hypothetical protein
MISLMLAATALVAIPPNANHASGAETDDMPVGSSIDFNGKAGPLARSGDRVEGFTARNVDNGLVRVSAPIDGLVIRNLRVSDVYRVLENGGTAASLRHLDMEHVHATGVRRGLARIRFDSGPGEIRDSSAIFAGPQLSPHLPAGIAFDGTAHDWLIERVVIRGAQMTMETRDYWNGDGFSTERGNARIRFVGCEAYDSTDAGFDLKGSEGWLDRTMAGGNGRNYRFWSTTEAGTITSLSPVKRGGMGKPAHVWIQGSVTNPPVIHIRKLIVHSDNMTPIVTIENGAATVIIDDYDIQVPVGTMVEYGGNKGNVWNWGPKGKPAL